MAPGYVGMNVPTYRGTGSPLDRSTLKIRMVKGAGGVAQEVECRFTGIKP
jgi:hypothetical protein